MGCGGTKLENFDGPPDEEIQFHAKSILLAAQSGEKGSGPETRVAHALTGILKATEQENAQIYPNSIYKLAAAIESLRLEAPQIFMKMKDEINDVRVSVFKRMVPHPEESDGGREEKKWASISWIPRVVSVEPTCVNYLGTSNEYGLTGTGAASLGFCVEAWVFNDKSKKQSDKNLFTLIDAAEANGVGREVGMSPSMLIDDDGRPVLDFYKKSCISSKSDLFPPNEWVHVAYVYGSEQMKVFVNGSKVGTKDSSPPMGQVSLSLCSGLGGYVTEMRVWMCERTDDEIRETMNKTITPYLSRQYPSLRLCWLPVAKGSPLYAPGALLYDCWRQQFVGSRKISSTIVDNRWPSAIPLQLIPDTNYLYASHYCDEVADLWEKFHTELFLNQPTLSKYKPELSILELKSLQIMNVLLGYGGPWIPRVVCLAPNSSICVGTTDELGLTGEDKPFTLECWIRIRIINENGNNFLEIGRGDPTNENQIIRIVLKNGCPSFTLSGQTIESDVGLPMMTWTHLAFVYDSKHQQIFANGTLIASTKTIPLTSSNTIIFGSSNPNTSFTSDLCELRLWNRALTSTEINEYMQTSIPPLGGKGHRNLRLTWLPLRNGGPFSQEIWCRRKLMINKLKPLSPAALKYIARPLPTLLWDVTQMRDVGTFIKSSDPLLTSRTRFIHIPHLIPTLNDLPQYWSKAAVAVIDEWTDCFDRAFVPKWYEVPQINEADHEAFAQIPTNASEAVMTRNSTWIGRVMKFPPLCNYSVPIGLTAELGLCGVATGGREFTLELWIKMKSTKYHSDDKKIIFEDILGHEDKESNGSTGFFGMGSPFALRIGLANGIPFMNFLGQIKSTKPSDLKEGVIASSPLVPGKWTHLAFVAIGDGKIVLYVNGDEVCRRERMNPLQAKGDTVVHAFGYEDRLLQSDICEMRLWSTARTKNEINETMSKCISPLPSGLARVPDLRLAWFPTNSMRSIFWDHKYVMIRGIYSDPQMSSESLPKYTRRPLSLPPKFLMTLGSLPPCYILDDRGDSYERHLSSQMVPPVVRLEDGSVDTSHFDKFFEPLAQKNAVRTTFAPTSTSTTREETDIGWYDTDDGMLSANQIYLDDGGWMDCWDKELLSKFQEEEAVDVSKFVPPVGSRAPSRSPSIAEPIHELMNEEIFGESSKEELKQQQQGEWFESQEQSQKPFENQEQSFENGEQSIENQEQQFLEHPEEGFQEQPVEGFEFQEHFPGHPLENYEQPVEGFESHEESAELVAGVEESEQKDFSGEESGSPNIIELGSPGADAILAMSQSADCLSPKKQDECRSNPDDVNEKDLSTADGANLLQESDPSSM